jgi:hypothetical protein
MIATKSPRILLPPIPAKKIPASLIYEIIDGKPIFYKGYGAVMNGTKTIEEVRGSSNLQSTIVEYLLMVLFKSIDLTKYRVLTNETGLHLSKKKTYQWILLVTIRMICL